MLASRSSASRPRSRVTPAARRPGWRRGVIAAAMLALAAIAVCARRSGVRAEPVRARTGGTLRVDTLWSQSLGARKRLIVYLPPSYQADASRRFAVAYYLHGLAGP